MILTKELLEAFRATHYLVDLPGQRVRLQVDAPCDALCLWLQSRGHFCAAVLTAHNPAARRRDAQANQSAQQQLRDMLRERGLEFVTGCNVDPQQRWPAEDSVLVGDLPLPQAQRLAAHFGQLAFLWCDVTAVPKLHLAAID